MPTLKLLAHVPELDPTTKAMCGWDEFAKTKAGQPVPKEARYPYFAEGYVDIGLPRDVFYVADITKATKGYAVADEQGNVIGKFTSLPAAEKALAGAKIRLTVDVEVPQEEDVDRKGADRAPIQDKEPIFND